MAGATIDGLLPLLRELPREVNIPVGWIVDRLEGVADDDPGDLTVTEVAHALRRAESTVRGLLIDGALDGYKVGRSWRIRREAVRDYLDAAAAEHGRKDPPNSVLRLDSWRNVARG